MNICRTLLSLHLGVLFQLGGMAVARAADDDAAALAAKLKALDARVLSTDKDKTAQFSQMIANDSKARMQAANLRESKAWQGVASKADWEKYRDQRIDALRKSLGGFPPAPANIKVRVTGQIQGEGYRIQNLVYESRPGLFATANLYSPAKPSSKAMPGILMAHSHHNPKSQIELQDMGINWARLGCLVLVPDIVGHGERRQHPFVDEASYPGTFRVGRQDYYFRYNAALQLHAVGESLAGWMVWDVMRGVDVLLAQPGIDKNRIVVLGAVAGGGDPAALAAALDSRIAAVAPFNFGGPQPDYAIPENTDRDFYWFGYPTWESTRCLRHSARDGFAHWLIVSSVAPRGLIYAHEFATDEKADPAWPRMQKAFALAGDPAHLAVAEGKGNIKGRPPEHSHCNNIGVLHRSKLYPILKSWLDLPIPEKESDQRHDAKELACLTPEVVKELQPRKIHELAAQIGAERVAAARQKLEKLSPEERRKQLRQDWAKLLGDIEPRANIKAMMGVEERIGDILVERMVLEVEPGIDVPFVLLLPREQAANSPIVVAIAQEGKEKFLKLRSQEIAELLRSGVIVCLPDLRGTGETQTGGPRSWKSPSSAVSQSELMLGQTLVGSRLRDLRSVIQHLRSRPTLKSSSIALWGDSFAAPNSADRRLDVPLDAETLPNHAEPLGGLLALLGGLYEDSVQAVSIQGGLTGHHALLQSPYCYVPHDAVVPGALTAGDLCDVAAALAPRPLRMEGMVDGLNRRVPPADVGRIFEPTRSAYQSAKAGERVEIVNEPSKTGSVAAWLSGQLKGK